MNVVIILIEHEGMVLIGRKIIKPGHEFSGSWHVPGGTVEPNEDILAAVAREAKEETGLDVLVNRSLGSFDYEDNHLHVYLCKPSAGIVSLCAGDDLEEVKFVEKPTVLDLYNKQRKRSWPQEVLDYLQS